MAARRLLIVMLVLLGISTLAAALVPQSTLNDDTTTQRTATRAQTTTAAAGPSPGYISPVKITVGGKKFPVISPVMVGDQLTMLVHSPTPTQIAIPAFGQLGFATPETPARFEILATTPGTFGVLYASTDEVAAQIRVVDPNAKRSKKAKRPARAESGPP